MPLVSEPDGTQQLRAGRAGFLLDGAELRYLTLDGVELVRRIYVAVRDESWATLVPDETAAEVECNSEALVVRAECRHESATAALRWRVEARVTAAGEVSYAAEFSPVRRFPFARIGICVLLPPAALIGRRFVAATEAGEVEGGFAAEIAPQWIEGERIMPMFESFSALRIAMAGHDLDLRFEGDLFEMEDQRNWSDGSFKVYGTPLSRPRPQQAEPGRPFGQKLRLAARAETGVVADTESEVAEIRLGPPGDAAVPGFGLSLEAARAAAARAPLGDLGLDHVHLELGAEDDGRRLTEATALAAEAGAALHVAARVADHDAAAMLADVLAPHAELIAWVLTFGEDGIGSGELVARAREPLAAALPGTRFAGGTDLAFADLNRTRPPTAGMEAIAWPVDPHVHGADALTAIEALAPQADQVFTARSFAPAAGALVGPVELRPPAALGKSEGARFAAAWATASLATLGEAGALAVTYRHWHPPAQAGAWRGRPVLTARSSEPLAVRALATSGDDARPQLLLANLRDRQTEVRIRTDATAATEVKLGPHEVQAVSLPTAQSSSWMHPPTS